MIITQTPLRVSFAGGGTDMKGYYARRMTGAANGGSVVSTAIDKYIYVIVKERFDRNIRVGYSRNRDGGRSRPDRARTGARGDAANRGARRASRSARWPIFRRKARGWVRRRRSRSGCSMALYTYQGELVTPDRLAREACEIEIDVWESPSASRTSTSLHSAACRRIDFHADERVTVAPIPLTDETATPLRRKPAALLHRHHASSADAILDRTAR